MTGIERIEQLRSATGTRSHRARDTATGGEVLVREIDAPGVVQRREMGRWLRDATLARCCRSPWVAPYLTAEPGAHQGAVVRAWIDGSPLAEATRYHPVDGAVGAGADAIETLAVGLLTALAEIHEAGWLCPRLSPRNIILVGDRPVLTDWGVRLPSWVASSGLSYQAPEVTAGEEPDPRSDLYALGAILHELLTGRLPGVGPELDALDLEPGPLRALLERLLAQAPSGRHATARTALASFGHEAPCSLDRTGVVLRGRVVGRSSEIEQLAMAVDGLAFGRGGAVFLRGPSGIGKSTLLQETARHAAAAGVRVVRGGGRDASRLPLGVLAGALGTLAREMADWSRDALVRCLGDDAGALLEASSAFQPVETLRTLRGVDKIDPEASRQRLLRTVCRAFAEYCRQQPTLLLIDDLDDADPLTVELIRQLVRTVIDAGPGQRGGHLLLVAGYAEAIGTRDPVRAMVTSLRVKAQAEEIVVNPLAPHDVRDLVRERLSATTPPAGFVARLMDQTDGNPLVVEMTLEVLARDGAFGCEPSQWADRLADVTKGGDESDETLRLLLGQSGSSAVATASVDRASPLISRELIAVPAIPRQALEAIALAGVGMSIHLLAEVCGLESEAVDAAVVELRGRKFVREVAPGQIELRHERLRGDIAADMLPPARKSVHLRLGHEIERQVTDIDERAPLLLAHHFYQAGDRERSLLYLPLAARLFMERHAMQDALGCFRRFFRYLESLEGRERERHRPRRLQALNAMAEAHVRLGHSDDASKAYREMAAVAEAASCHQEVVVAWSGIAQLSLSAGDSAQAESFARRAVTLAREQDLPSAVAANMCVLGEAELRRGRFKEAMWSLSAALDIYRDRADVLGQARVLTVIGDVFAGNCRRDEAVKSYKQGCQLYRKLDDKRAVARTLNRIGRLHAIDGDPVLAIAHHREALKSQREADLVEGTAAILDDLAAAYLKGGDLEHAQTTWNEALALKRESADVRGSAESLLGLAEVARAGGRDDEALGLLQQALTLARRTSHRSVEAGCLTHLSVVLLERGETARSRQAAEDGLAAARAAGDSTAECWALLALSSVSNSSALATAQQAADLADAIHVRELRMLAHAQLGVLLRAADDAPQAVLHYTRALDEACELLRTFRGAPTAFQRHRRLLTVLADAGAFLAANGAADPQRRFPVLQLASSVELSEV